jgi:hypothetical protein
MTIDIWATFVPAVFGLAGTAIGGWITWLAQSSAKENLDYSKRCALAFALGLNKEIKPALSAVGKLRNKLAHQPERHLTAEDAENLYSVLSSRERQSIPGFLDHMVRSPKVTSFTELSPMDKYVLILVVLRSIVVAAQSNIENAHPGR